jgi:cysteine-rich repeat protein
MLLLIAAAKGGTLLMSLQLCGLLTSLLLVCLLASCNQREQDTLDLASHPKVQESKKIPINIVINKDDPIIETDQAPAILPTPILPEPIPASPVVAEPIPAPLGPPPPFVFPPPPPVGLIVEEEKCVEAFCGDDIRQHGEDCDDGNDDNTDNCDNFCRTPICGNGTIEGDEECDNPDNINCTNECTLPLCGNGIINDNETCDPPNNSNCNANCQLSVCGNSIVELGEQCDDGANGNNADGCNDSCQLSCEETTPVSRRRPRL